MARKKFSLPMEHDADGMRFATPERVAAYRARRLSCATLLEIGCGIGGQTIAFARTCERVMAVDIDPVKVECAKRNCRRAGVDNVEFFVADGASEEFASTIEEVDYVFCDPTRAPAEPTRTLESLNPSPTRLLSLYKGVCRGLAIEAPPQLAPDRVPLRCEREYLSLDGTLNRLTLYFGELMECERSCVSLSDHESRLCSGGEGKVEIVDAVSPLCFEPDPALIKAGLLRRLAHVLKETLRILVWDEKRCLLTSEHMLHSPFLVHSFLVVAHLKGGDAIKRANELLKERAKRVLIRGSLSPREYWGVRGALERGIHGNEVFHAFLRDDEVLLLKLIA